MPRRMMCHGAMVARGSLRQRRPLTGATLGRTVSERQFQCSRHLQPAAWTKPRSTLNTGHEIVRFNAEQLSFCERRLLAIEPERDLFSVMDKLRL